MSSLPRILLVEDNPGDVELLRQAFEEGHYRVEIIAAHDGRQALRLIEEAASSEEPLYGIFVLDLNVPIINGSELLTRIKSDPRLRSIPTVVLTSSTSPTDRDLSERLQASAFLIKPQSVGDYAAIARMLWSHIERPR